MTSRPRSRISAARAFVWWTSVRGRGGWGRGSPSCIPRASEVCSSSSSNTGAIDRSLEEEIVDKQLGAEATGGQGAVFSGRHDRRKVTDWVYEEVRQAIIDLRLQPGE